MRNTSRRLFLAGIVAIAALAANVRCEDTFTLAILPDLQPEETNTWFHDRLVWMVNNRTALNMKMMLQVGDMMNFNDPVQYQHQSEALKVLDNASFPYATCLGNHDTAAVKVDGGSAAPGNVNTNLRNTTCYNTYFPLSRYKLLGGVYEAGKIDNAFHTFNAGGLDWLVINLELWARTGAVDWAKSVVASHPNHNVIFLTHAHLEGNSTIQQNNGGYGNNSPQYVFDQAMKPYANVRLVFSGHVGTHGYRTDTGTNGNTIYQFLQCYHDNTTNPTRLLTIDTKNGTMASRVYCQTINQDKNDGSTFTVTGVNWVRPAATVPAAPTALKATAVSSTQVNLSWTDGSNNETGFKIERKTGSSGTWGQIATAGANVTTYSNTGLSATTQYYYRVRANNASGDSGYSNEANATTAAPAGTGTGLRGEYFDNSDLTAPKLTRVDATVDFNWGDGTPDASVVADTFSARWTGLVQALFSETYTFSTVSDDGVRLWVNGQQLVNNWTDHGPTTDSGSIAMTAGQSYTVTMEYYENTGGAVARLLWSSPSTPQAVVPQSQLYPPPSAPTNLVASAASSSQINLSWTDNANNETGFKIERKTGAGGTWAQIATVGANVTTYANTGLSAVTQYYYRVRANNAAGDSAYSNEANATTQDVPPSAPTNLAASAVSAAQINLNWTDAANNETGFKIERKTGAGGTWAQIATVGANVTTLANTGLSAGTQYYYRVRATNAAGDSAYSNEANATMQAPPAFTAQPANTTVTAGQAASFTAAASGIPAPSLQWQRSTDGGTTFGNIAGATSGTYATPATAAADNGAKYRCVATNSAGSAVSSAATLTVNTAIIGNGIGLRGEYYDNADLTAWKISRVDATVDFDWGNGTPDAAIGADTFSVLWHGWVQPQFSETYTFYTVSDDGVHLRINGQTVIDNWTDHSPTENSGTFAMTAGQKYEIFLEMYENGGGAVAQLLWSSPSTPKAVIPKTQLYAGPWVGAGSGLLGEYYDNADFTNWKLTRVDAAVNFDWGTGSPAATIGADTFSVRWTGRVQASYTETHTFYTDSDDGVRLWINGQLLIDNWTDHPPTENSATIALTAGQTYTVTMEWYENGGGAVAQLYWSCASSAKAIVPKSQLYPAAANIAPTMSSPATVSFTPVLTGQAATFSVAASDNEGNALSYTWDFGDGTNGSGASVTHVYGAAGVYNVVATANDGHGGVVSSVVAVTVNANVIPGGGLKINFQPAAVAVPAGHLADAGAVYGDRGNGYSYGWTQDNSLNARDRDAANAPDQRYDTLIHMQKPEYPNAIWELALPNGMYTVRLVCGDPSYFNSVYQVNVENVLTVSGTPTDTVRWLEGTKTVVVNDGRLTLTNAAGAVINKLNFIEISSAVAAAREVAADTRAAEPLTVTALQVKVDFSKKNRDGSRVSGTLALPAGFKTAGVRASVDVGAAIVNFTLDAKGCAKNKNGTLVLKRAAKGPWTFKAALKGGTWRLPWSDGDVANATVKERAVRLPVTLTLGDQVFGGSKALRFSAKANKSGQAK